MASIMALIILAIMAVLWDRYMDNYTKNIKIKESQKINTSGNEDDELNFSKAIDSIVISDKSQIKIGR